MTRRSEVRRDFADAHFNKALALLLRGDYADGFAEYEWRWRRTGMPLQQSRGKPLWLGEYPLARKTVLLHAEQGLGDTIQFARYAPVIAASGARVVLEVQAELKELMRRLDGVAAVIARGEEAPPFDVHCPLGSLPLALHTEPSTVPAQIPYLPADDARLAKWSARLDALPRPRIAIAWSGNPSHDNDRNRSIAFARLAQLFARLLPRGGGSFVGIQRDVRGEDAAALAAETRVAHIGDELEDFSDTAAVLALCDLVITVDTAVAHLAGAMGRPVWVLVPVRAGLALDARRRDYALVSDRAAVPADFAGDWDGVIARMADELRRFVISGLAMARRWQCQIAEPYCVTFGDRRWPPCDEFTVRAPTDFPAGGGTISAARRTAGARCARRVAPARPSARRWPASSASANAPAADAVR